MNFLKNNLVAILISLAAYGTLAYANTIVRPYGPPDYAGGQKAVGTKVDAEFQNIVTWLNTGNISSVNIDAGGVETVNLADDSVTSAKMGALNITISDASSYFSTNATTDQDVTNLSRTITSYGRPIKIELQSTATVYPYNDGLGNLTTLSSWVEAPTGDNGRILIIKGSSTLVDNRIEDGRSPCSEFSYIDQVPAGTYTYKIAARVDTGGGSLEISGCRLVVREL